MSWHSDLLKRAKYAKTHLYSGEEEGVSFGTSVRQVNVADDGTLNMLLLNPSDSDKALCWLVLETASEGKTYLDLYGDVVTNATGTAALKINKHAGSSTATVARVEYNGSYIFTSANLMHETVIPGGTGPHSLGGGTVDAEIAIGDPGHNVLVQLTNKGGAAKDMSLRIVWMDCEII